MALTYLVAYRLQFFFVFSALFSSLAKHNSIYIGIFVLLNLHRHLWPNILVGSLSWNCSKFMSISTSLRFGYRLYANSF
jgi:hypothetical protein